jgi:hypothetical protein
MQVGRVDNEGNASRSCARHARQQLRRWAEPKGAIHMIRNFLMAAAGLALVVAAAPAQRASVVRLDADQKVMVVKIGEAEHKVDTTNVKLLDADGKVAAFTDFAVKDNVMVTMAEERITTIQKLASLFAAYLADEGKVVSVDADHRSMVVKVGTVEHTVNADRCKLLDKDGKEAKLEQFAAGAKVDVTMSEEGTVAKVQLQ